MKTNRHTEKEIRQLNEINPRKENNMITGMDYHCNTESITSDDGTIYYIRTFIPDNYCGTIDITLGEKAWGIVFERGAVGDKKFFENLKESFLNRHAVELGRAKNYMEPEEYQEYRMHLKKDMEKKD